MNIYHHLNKMFQYIVYFHNFYSLFPVDININMNLEYSKNTTKIFRKKEIFYYKFLHNMFLDFYMDYFYIHQYLLNKYLQSILVNKYIFLDYMYHIYMDYLLNKLYFEFLFYHMNNSMDKNIDNHQVNFHMLHLKNMVMMHNNFVF